MYFSKFEKPHNFSLPRTFFCGHCSGSGVNLQWVPLVKGPGINHMKRKGKQVQNSVKTYYSQSGF